MYQNWMTCPHCGRKCNVSYKRLTYCPGCNKPVQCCEGEAAAWYIVGLIVAAVVFGLIAALGH